MRCGTALKALSVRNLAHHGDKGPMRWLLSMAALSHSPLFLQVQKIMTQPINLIFRFLQSKQRIQIWLFDQVS